MVSEQQPIMICAEPDHGEANKRRSSKIEALATILRENLLQTLLARRFVQ